MDSWTVAYTDTHKVRSLDRQTDRQTDEIYIEGDRGQMAQNNIKTHWRAQAARYE